MTNALSLEQLASQTLPSTHERLDTHTAQPPLYRVIIHNDNVTPMDFVVHILTSIFQLAAIHALQVMFTAHHNGSAAVQVLPRPEAQRRVGLAHVSARFNRYPLTFTIEPE